MTVHDSSQDAIRVENSLDLLLVLLYAPGRSGAEGEPVSGITRLQKLIFLLNQGVGPSVLVESAKQILYKPFKMGPFAPELYRDLETLQSLGFVRSRRLEFLIPDDSDPGSSEENENSSADRVVESSRFELTENGMKVGKELFDNMRRRDREGLVQFKEFFNSIPLRQLLIFVYRKYPKYTSESEIKGQLGI